MEPERLELARFLEDTFEIDWQAPAIMERAAALTRHCETETERIRALFEWVRDDIDHSLDVETNTVTCRASDVLKQRTGLGFAKSHLLVALLRARGIPSGFGYQRLRREPPERGFALHGFAGVYLGDEERWIALDPRGDNEVRRTPFRTDAPALAYEPDPEHGECTYPTLYARPNKRVLDVLDRIDDLAIARKHLPDAL